MKKLLLFLLAVSAFTPAVRAADEKPAATQAPDGLSADEIVQMVHLSRALQNNVLKGELTKSGKSTPFTVQLKEDLIHFSFDNPKQNINLNINDKGFRLKEVTANSNKEVPAAMYGTGVRGTDLTYDDISFRYLYWATKKKVGEETIKTRKCYVVDLYNPARLGEYYLVRIFVDKESGGMMRMQAYDWNGKLIKSCAVTSAMKINGSTVLKSMDVIRYVPGTKKVAGETNFELHKPSK